MGETSRDGIANKPKVVLLGGGNGTSRLLLALLPLLKEKEIDSLHALVHMSDDGGSTGRLREQYGVAAAGDLTRCLMALSGLQGDLRGNEFLEALEYRFAEGDFAGHSLRNILLTALQKTESGNPDSHGSDIDAAIATMARILRVPKYAGVVPTTEVPLTEQVVITFDGQENLLGEGQFFISHSVNVQADPRWLPGDVRVKFAEGDVPLNPRARQLIEEATHIVVAPGHTFGTILPTLALPALAQAISGAVQAKLWAVGSLLTTPQQTVGWSGEDFIRVYESYMGREVDVVFGNDAEADMTLVDGQGWVKFQDNDHPYELILDNFVSSTLPHKQAGDGVPRAVVVHDVAKVSERMRELL